MNGAYPGYEGYRRVSEVCDAASRLGSDGLMFVGATWAAQRAIEITSEIMNGGTPPDYLKFLEVNEGGSPVTYLQSKWFANSIKAGATRKQQAAADRGTLLNRLWDELNQTGP